jgi:hypothetical protein
LTEEGEKLQIYSVEDGVTAEATRKLYKVFFDNFLDYCQIQDPSVLLNESPRQIEDRIIGYVRLGQGTHKGKR